MPYDLFLPFVKRLLSHPRKESDVRKRVRDKLDILPAQFKHWLEKSLADGILVRREVLSGKRKIAMLEVSL